MNAEKTIRFEQVINNLKDLPTLPVSILKIIEEVENPDSTAQSLTSAISMDQSISSTILRLVNSAYYGHRREVASIPQAVVILGYQMVKNMALGVSMFQTQPVDGQKSIDRGSLWSHSVAVATCAGGIASDKKVSAKINRDEAFLAGLLHDIGKVVFDTCFPDEYRQVLKMVSDKGGWIGDAERHVMGLDHARAGFHLASKWNFPEPVCEAIRCHHDFNKLSIGENHISAIIHVGDYCARQIKLGSGGDMSQAPFDKSALTMLGITEEGFVDLLMELDEKRSGMMALFH